MPAAHASPIRLLTLLFAAALALSLAVVPASALASPATHAKRAHSCAKVHRSATRHTRHTRRHARCARVSQTPRPTLVAPTQHATISPGAQLRARATVRVPVRRVTFRVDGRIVKDDRTAPYSFSAKARRFGVGEHHVAATAAQGAKRYSSGVVSVDVSKPQASPTASPTASPDATADRTWAAGKSWTSSFENSSFTEWSWWGQGQSNLWGHINVVDAVSAGIPPLGGSKVARFQTTADDIAHGRESAKLYKSFTRSGSGTTGGPPADVSGVYSAWYYVPDSYSVPGSSSVNMFQFKEEYSTSSGPQSDPLWWVQLGPVHWATSMSQAYGGPAITGRSDAPVAFINYWGNNWREKRSFVPLPLGRWFEIKAVLHQNDRIDFYLDGKPLDTARASTYPVSPFHGARSQNWTFGIGNYSSGANGPLYADRASYKAL